MTQQVAQEGLKTTVAFERSVQVAPYQTAKASIYVNADIPHDSTVGDPAWVKAVEDAWFEAKSSVLTQVGAVFSTTPDGLVEEDVEATIAQLQQAFPGAKEQSAPARGGRPQNGRGGGRQAAASDVPDCPNCAGPMWDNRATKKGRQPDFRCKDKTCKDGEYVTSLWVESDVNVDDEPF